LFKNICTQVLKWVNGDLGAVISAFNEGAGMVVYMISFLISNKKKISEKYDDSKS